MVHSYDCGSSVIAINTTDGSAVAASPHFKYAESLVVECPDTVTGTITCQGSFDGGSSYSNIQSGGADVTIAAGDCVTFTVQGWTHIRVQSDSSEAAERIFLVRAVGSL